MSIIKIHHRDTPYVIIDKSCLDDTRLSWRARGLLAYLLSRPPNWAVKIRQLVKQATEGRDAVYAIINELIQFGYIVRIQARNEQGRITGWDHIVYEISQNPLPDNQDVEAMGEKTPFPEFQDLDRPHPEKPDALINNDINNKYLNKAAAEEGSVKSNPSDNRIEPLAAAAIEKNEDEENNAIDKSNKTTNTATRQSSSPTSENPAQAESLLGSELTTAQQAWVRKILIPLAKTYEFDLSVLADGVTVVLLDNDSFKKTGRDFHHKLNAIVKEIKKGQWRTPAKLLLAEEKQAAVIASEKNERYQALLDELKGYERDRLHWKKLLTYNKREQDVALYDDIINRCDMAIARIQQQLNHSQGEIAC